MNEVEAKNMEPAEAETQSVASNAYAPAATAGAGAAKRLDRQSMVNWYPEHVITFLKEYLSLFHSKTTYVPGDAGWWTALARILEPKFEIMKKTAPVLNGIILKDKLKDCRDDYRAYTTEETENRSKRGMPNFAYGSSEYFEFMRLVEEIESIKMSYTTVKAGASSSPTTGVHQVHVADTVKDGHLLPFSAKAFGSKDKKRRKSVNGSVPRFVDLVEEETQRILQWREEDSLRYERSEAREQTLLDAILCLSKCVEIIAARPVDQRYGVTSKARDRHIDMDYVMDEEEDKDSEEMEPPKKVSKKASSSCLPQRASATQASKTLSQL